MKCSALAVSFLAAIGSASAVSGGNLRRRTECKPAGTWDCAPAADEPAAHPTWIWKESPVEQIYARQPQCLNDDHCALKCCLRHHNGFNACQDPATKNQYQKCIGPYLDQTAEEATSANEEPAEAEEPAAAEVEEPVAEVEEPATEVEEPAEPADDEQPEDANVEQPENVKYPAGYMVAPPPAGEPYRDWVWKDLDPVQQMYDGIPQCRNDNHCATKCCIRFHNGFNACQNPATVHSWQRCIGPASIGREDSP